MVQGILDLTQGQDWKPKVYLVQPENYGQLGQSFVGKILDSAMVDKKGHFQFETLAFVEDSILLEVVVQKKGERYANRLENENPELDNYMPIFWIPGEMITMNAAIDRFQSSAMIENPSEVNATFLELRDLKKNAFLKYQSTFEQLQGDEQLLEREKALHEYQSALMHFADTTEDLASALMAIKWVSPEGNYERIPEFLVSQSQKWKTRFPFDPWVQELAVMADKERLPILIGDQIPDLQFPMLDGIQTNLKTILGGQKLVILDVWASWCAPCRLENRNVLLPLWKKYHDLGFQVIAYGLESNRAAWENAIEKDGASPWLHTSHLEGDQNPVMDSLRIHTIPANFILDGSGKVLAKNLHGEALVDFVANYLGS
jgi:Thiol-disulfide isomerase and thioredoxins